MKNGFLIAGFAVLMLGLMAFLVSIFFASDINPKDTAKSKARWDDRLAVVAAVLCIIAIALLLLGVGAAIIPSHS